MPAAVGSRIDESLALSENQRSNLTMGLWDLSDTDRAHACFSSKIQNHGPEIKCPTAVGKSAVDRHCTEAPISTVDELHDGRSGVPRLPFVLPATALDLPIRISGPIYLFHLEQAVDGEAL